jgi:hypothetical protein
MSRQPHWVRSMVLGATVLVVVVVAAVIVSVAHGLGTGQVAGGPAPTPTSSSLSHSQVVLTPSPTMPTGTPVSLEFVLSGYAPRNGRGVGPEITYGSDRSTHEAQPPGINGTVTYSVPFDPAAHRYAVRAQLSGSGHLTCAVIVIRSRPDKPLTVSSGYAHGGDSVCSARAIESDPEGRSWRGGS